MMTFVGFVQCGDDDVGNSRCAVAENALMRIRENQNQLSCLMMSLKRFVLEEEKEEDMSQA
jgi:hypothetical protein